MRKESQRASRIIQVFFKFLTVLCVLGLLLMIVEVIKDFDIQLIVALVPLTTGLWIIGSIGFTGFFPKSFYKSQQ